ncbi:MAG: ATP-binding protein [Phycisphaerales bacterium]|nr:ATP-binding protein [Phycisphaerales bacterium]
MDALRIGYVTGVEGDAVEVRITHQDAEVHYQGAVYRVGKLGTYVTLPRQRNTLIGYIVRVSSHGEFDAHNRPSHVALNLQLLGTIQEGRFTRGVNEYPTIGDPVHIASEDDFAMIFGHAEQLAAGSTHRKSFSLGRFAVDTNFEVQALGKEFFAKHCAVMGNSGSGKSVTTAKILHEALQLPHTQIVMFDMHGEYLSAFSDEQGKPLPNVNYLSDRNLVLPYWMLQYGEFERLFVDTNNTLNVNAQRVFLRAAFERLKRTAAEELDLLTEYTVDTPIYYNIEQLKVYAENMNDARYVLNTENYAFARLPYRQLPAEEQEHMLLTRRMDFNKGDSEGEVPHATYFGHLLGLVNQIETRLNDRRYDFLLRPFEQVRRNPDLAGCIRTDATPGQLSRPFPR